MLTSDMREVLLDPPKRKSHSKYSPESAAHQKGAPEGSFTKEDSEALEEREYMNKSEDPLVPISGPVIFTAIERLFGFKVGRGLDNDFYGKGGTIGLHYALSEMIRVKSSEFGNDTLLSHEVAHNMDKKFTVTGKIYTLRKKGVPIASNDILDEASALDYATIEKARSTIKDAEKKLVQASETTIDELKKEIEEIKGRAKKAGELSKVKEVGIKDLQEKIDLFEKYPEAVKRFRKLKGQDIQKLKEQDTEGIYEFTPKEARQLLTDKGITGRHQEGFAEFVRIWLTDGLGMDMSYESRDGPSSFVGTNPTLEKFAPKFYKWWIEEFLTGNLYLNQINEIKELLKKEGRGATKKEKADIKRLEGEREEALDYTRKLKIIRGLFKRRKLQPVSAKVGATVMTKEDVKREGKRPGGVTEGKRNDLRLYFDRAMMTAKDMFWVLDYIVPEGLEAGKRSPTTTVYQHAQVLHGTAAERAHYWMENGVSEYLPEHKGLPEVKTRTLYDAYGLLKEEEIDRKEPQAYMKAKLTIELAEKIPKEREKKRRALGVEGREKEAGKDVIYSTGSTHEDALEVVAETKKYPEKMKRWDEAHEILTEISGALVEISYRAGIHDFEEAKAIRKYKYYLPLYRTQLGPKGWGKRKKLPPLQVMSPFHFRTQEGSKEDIQDFFESIELQAIRTAQGIHEMSLYQKLGAHTQAAREGEEGWGKGDMYFVRSVDPERVTTTQHVEDVLTQLEKLSIITSQQRMMIQGVWILREEDLDRRLPTPPKKWSQSKSFKEFDEKIRMVERLHGTPSMQNTWRALVGAYNEKGADRKGLYVQIKDYLSELRELTVHIASPSALLMSYRPKLEAVDGKNIIAYKIGGKTELLEVDNYIYKSLQVFSTSTVSANVFSNIYAKFADLVKAGAVTLAPAFATANVVRDWIAVQLQAKEMKGFQSTYDPMVWLSKYLFYIAVKNDMPIVSGLTKQKRNEIIDHYLALGGAMDSMFGQSEKALTKFNKAMKKKHSMNAKQGFSILGLPSRGFQGFKDLIAMSDMGPRIAEFAATLANLGYTMNKEGYIVNREGDVETPPAEVLMKARLAAANVSINFRRMGTWLRHVNKYTVFLNAAMEGMYRSYQTIPDMINSRKEVRAIQDLIDIENENLKAAKTESEKEKIKKGIQELHDRMEVAGRPAARFLWFTMINVSLTAAYWFSRHDDDDYKTKPAWMKNGYFNFAIFGRDDLRIPKGYGLPALMSNFVESLLESTLGSNPDALKEFASFQQKSEGWMMPMDLISRLPIVSTGWEIVGNRDLFLERPIEGRGLENRHDWDRYDERTNGLMKWLGYYTGKTVGWSPKELEHITNKTTGGLWKRTVEYAKKAYTVPSAKDFPDLISKTVDLIPGKKAFTITKGQTRDLDDFYNRIEKVSRDIQGRVIRDKELDSEMTKEQALGNRYKKLLAELRAIQREKEYGKEEWYQYQVLMIGAAREALGKEPLESYKSPFARDVQMPDEARAIRNRFVTLMIDQAQQGLPSKIYSQFDSGDTKNEMRDFMRTRKYVSDRKSAALEWLQMNHYYED